MSNGTVDCEIIQGCAGNIIQLTPEYCMKYIPMKESYWLRELTICQILMSRSVSLRSYLATPIRIDPYKYINIRSKRSELSAEKMYVFVYPRYEKIISDMEVFTDTMMWMFIRDMRDTLEYMKVNGIFHKDIKMSNIAYHDDHFILFDYSHSNITNRSNHTTNGTVAITAPEVLKGGPYTHKSDIFSAGIVLLSMYLGNPASVFKGLNTDDDYIRFYTSDDFMLAVEDRIKYCAPILDPYYTNIIRVALRSMLNVNPDERNIPTLPERILDHALLPLHRTPIDNYVLPPTDKIAELMKTIYIYHTLVNNKCLPIGAIVIMCMRVLDTGIYTQLEPVDVAAIIYYTAIVHYDIEISEIIHDVHEYSIDRKLFYRALVDFINRTAPNHINIRPLDDRQVTELSTNPIFTALADTDDIKLTLDFLKKLQEQYQNENVDQSCDRIVKHINSTIPDELDEFSLSDSTVSENVEDKEIEVV